MKTLFEDIYERSQATLTMAALHVGNALAKHLPREHATERANNIVAALMDQTDPTEVVVRMLNNELCPPIEDFRQAAVDACRAWYKAMDSEQGKEVV